MKFSTAILTKVALSFFVLQGATALPASTTTNELSTTTFANAGLAQLVARSLAEAAFEREDIEANFIRKIFDKIFKKDKPKPIEQKPLHQIQNEMWKPHKPQPGDIKFTPRSVKPDLEIAHLMARSLAGALSEDEDVQANIFKTIINFFKKDKPKPIEQKPLHQIQNEMWKPHKPQPGDIKFTPRSAEPDLEIAHLMARSLAGALSEDEDVQANIFKTIINFFKKDKPKPIEKKPLHQIQNEMWKPHKPQPGDIKFTPK